MTKQEADRRGAMSIAWLTPDTIPTKRGGMMELSITLRRAVEENACSDEYEKIRLALGEGWGLDDSLPISRVLEIGGLADALWCFCCTPPEQEDLRRWVVSLWLADVLERIEHLMPHLQSRAVIPLLRRHAQSPVSKASLTRATWAAREAEAWATWRARAAVVWATRAAREAMEWTMWAARATRMVEAKAGAMGVARAAREARAAAWAEEEEETWQAERLAFYINTEGGVAVPVAEWLARRLGKSC